MTASNLLNSASIAALLCLGVVAAVPAAAQSAATPQVQAQFVQFTPTANPTRSRLDYSIWDEAMKSLVVSMGPSLRKAAGSEVTSFGTRRRYGTNSRYRLEGTRLMFSFLTREAISTFTEYRTDLEATATEINIASLSRNEQLAFWINLHNVALVEQIALNWPIRQPRQIEIGGVALDEAKFITVNGVAMSPKDIRTQIVYPNWKDPRVIYGFWRGDIGGPSLQRSAFNGENLDNLLSRSAREFVNSLRGTERQGNTLNVSDIYTEVAPYYFPNFTRDLRNHIATFASVDLQEELGKSEDVSVEITEYDIADLAGGVREPSYTNVTSNGASTRFRIPQSMARLLAQRERKFDIIEREGGRTGTITFIDIDLPSDPEDKGEIE